MVEPEEKTLRARLFLSNMSLEPMGITLPRVTGNWKLKHTLIHMLPKFSDMPGEDPIRHIQDFEMVCRIVLSVTPNNPHFADYVRMLTFPFFLQDRGREWVYTLPTWSVTTWKQLQQKFLERYYPIAQI